MGYHRAVVRAAASVAASVPVAGVRSSLHAPGGRAVLVERGHAISELGERVVRHSLDVEEVGPGRVGELVILDSGGTIHRFRSGAAPSACWQVPPRPLRIGVAGMSGDSLAVTTYGRLWRRLDMVDLALGRRRWRRTGLATVAPVGDDILAIWRHHGILDGQRALSRIDGSSGRDIWRLGESTLLAAIVAHPAHADARTMVIRLRGDAPVPPSWPPRLVATVGERVWLSLAGGDLGSYLFALDLSRGDLVAAVGLRARVPDGVAAEGRYHLLTAGAYEVFDLERDGTRELHASLGGLPTLGCRIAALVGRRRALLASRDGHLIAVDADQPKSPRVLWQARGRLVGDVVVAAGRLHFLHYAPRDGGTDLVTMEAP